MIVCVSYTYYGPLQGYPSLDEDHFVATEKRGLIRPYLKKIGLDINDLSNYCPVTNDPLVQDH